MGFDQFIADEMAKYNGICFPVKSSVLKRFLTKRLPCKKLHPNPMDEFSMPSIGPSYRIISDYEQQIKQSIHYSDGDFFSKDPIIVEKMHPEDYIIVNGHHRWAAAMRLGVKKVPVKIVNLTHESDIKMILANSKHDKRVTIDLDEVIFGISDDSLLEKKLPFPFNYEYKERIRAGVPALFHFLAQNGYDIWVFTSKFYSMDYLKQLFKHYHAHVDGLVTGTAKRNTESNEARKRVDKLIADKYRYTLNIDDKMVLLTHSGSKDFTDYEIDTSNHKWSESIMSIVEGIEKDE